MNSKIIPVGNYQNLFNSYLPYNLNQTTIYQSSGLKKHIIKRHPECTQYIKLIPSIISQPDYIGINPNEPNISFELVKVLSDNIQIGIKLDSKDNYLYVATLHTITKSKLQQSISNGRLKKIDK